MKKLANSKTRRLVTIAGLLCVWSMGSVYLYLIQDPTIHLLGILLNISIILIALWQPFPFAAWLLFILSVLIATGSAYFLLGVTNQFFISSIVGAGIFLITTILSTLYKRHVNTLAGELGYQNQVIDSLTVFDPKTSLMHWRFARRSLSTEILRSKRYNGTLSLIFFEVQKNPSSMLKKHKKWIK